MAKAKGVVKLRHRKAPHLEVHLYEDEETKKGHPAISSTGERVTTFQQNKGEAKD